ncbi:MAG: NusA-like transcription termination signal-binding factor [Hadesarchaea archaeon]|nr:NusA-like transcription termination signal-binding factor [Hadesarchaea archaeon]
MKIKLDSDKIRKISLFEKVTGATAIDCVESQDGNRLTFIVKKNEIGKAIGKNGKNISKVREKLGKSVDVVEYAKDPAKFISNIFSSVDLEEVNIIDSEEGKIAKVKVDRSEKGKVVGRDGWNIKRARELLARHHEVSDITLT